MVKATYKNDLKQYQKFGRFHTFRVRWKNLAAVCGALIIASIILLILKQTTFAVGLVLALLYPLLTFLLQYFRINKTVGANANFSNTVNNYMFDFSNEYMVLEIKQGKREEVHEIYYSTICKAYETKTNYYLYLNSLSALIIDKNYLEGDERELTGILDYYMGKRFHSKNKKTMTKFADENESVDIAPGGDKKGE